MSEVPQRSSCARKIPPERLAEVERRILLVESAPDIERECSKAWAITRRQVRNYIAIVRRRLGDRVKDLAPEADAAQARSMIEAAFRMARGNGDAKGMVAAAKTFADVTGVTAPKKFDHTSNGETIGVVPNDPRWTELQREHLGAARQGVSDEARPDGDADPLAAK